MSKPRSPVRSLIAFEAAARHGNFTRAAEELALTQAAISQQIRLLEHFLGHKLFYRGPRSVKLTAEGRQLARATSASLEHLERAIQELRKVENDVSLTVVASPAFCSFWLLPKLPRFLETQPNLSLELIATDQELSENRTPFDIAIWGGYGHWPEYHVEAVAKLAVYPVCSPAYLGRRRLKGAEDLLSEKLLHLNTSHRDKYVWMDWDTWFSQVGTPNNKIGRLGFQISSYALLIQAARQGQGIALGWSKLVEDLLENKELIRPISTELSTNISFYLVQPKHKLTPTAKRFRDWVKQEMRFLK